MDSLNTTTAYGGSGAGGGASFGGLDALLPRRSSDASHSGAAALPDRDSLKALIAQKERELASINEYRVQSLETELAEAVRLHRCPERGRPRWPG